VAEFKQWRSSPLAVDRTRLEKAGFIPKAERSHTAAVIDCEQEIESAKNRWS
jgi:hypothetical protein